MKRICQFALITLVLVPLAAATQAEQTRLAAIFTDHMILQRELPVAIWGTGAAGDTVTVAFAGQKKSTTIDPSGQWQVKLDPLAASAVARDLTVESKGQKINLTDVVVGEVWLASGQSNMEWPLNRTTAASTAIATAADPQFRIFDVAHCISDKPVNVVSGEWAACTASNVGTFSAVGYYFGKELRQALKLPVGVICSAWGGTPAQAWTPEATLAANPLLQRRIAEFEAGIRDYDPVKSEEIYRAALVKFKDAAAKAKAEGKPAPNPPVKRQRPGPTRNSPARLYNGMIAPLVPLSFRGVIWYQGEADASRAGEYRTLFPALIKSWRQAFGHDFPFLFVQIAPYKEQPPEIRDAQLDTWRTVPNTAMAVITDYGDARTIHPQTKAPVGVRLALAARALAYGEKIEYSGPVFDTVKFDGARAILSFQHSGSGLLAKGGPLKGFTITGDTNFVPATATLDGQHVIVTSDQVAKPVAVRYGWENVPDVNLFNNEGLPATPFRTDK